MLRLLSRRVLSVRPRVRTFAAAAFVERFPHVKDLLTADAVWRAGEATPRALFRMGARADDLPSAKAGVAERAGFAFSPDRRPSPRHRDFAISFPLGIEEAEKQAEAQAKALTDFDVVVSNDGGTHFVGFSHQEKFVWKSSDVGRPVFVLPKGTRLPQSFEDAIGLASDEFGHRVLCPLRPVPLERYQQAVQEYVKLMKQVDLSSHFDGLSLAPSAWSSADRPAAEGAALLFNGARESIALSMGFATGSVAALGEALNTKSDPEDDLFRHGAALCGHVPLQSIKGWRPSFLLEQVLCSGDADKALSLLALEHGKFPSPIDFAVLSRFRIAQELLNKAETAPKEAEALRATAVRQLLEVRALTHGYLVPSFGSLSAETLRKAGP